MTIVAIAVATVPLVALLFVVSRIGTDYLARSSALRELPPAARALGLEQTEAPAPGTFGAFAGRHGTHAIRLHPESYGLIVVELEGEPALALSTHSDGASVTLPHFDSGDASFDATFRDRRAEGPVAERLRADAALRTRLVEAVGADALAAGNVTIERGEVRVNAREARWPFHYIRPHGLAERLEAAIALARDVEALR